MITMRRATDRHCKRSRGQEICETFHFLDGLGPLSDSFGSLVLLSESRLPHGANAPHPKHRNAEVLTYVREGTLAYEDSSGRSGVIQAGEFELAQAGQGVRRGEANASRTEPVHFFQLWLRSAPGLDASKEQKRFSVAERRRELCVVASPDTRKGSLFVQQDVSIYSALLDAGQHLVHELSHGRMAWLHLVKGEVTLGDAVLTTGDGVGISEERAMSLTAREDSEVLLLDLAAPVQALLSGDRSTARD